jgi:signal recognition particle subunit SRP54
LRILLCGLQGSGKTTAAAKLAVHLKKFGIKSLLIACDLQRPAAIEQLRLLAEQSGADFFSLPGAKTPLEVAQAAFMQKPGYGAYIFDTAGRLQIDEALMAELKSVADEVDAQERLLVVDSALGAQAINVAESFHKAVGVTGIVLAKLDGDARGGAALSIASLTGSDSFRGSWRAPEDFERFYPERMAGRILGWAMWFRL